MTNILCGRQAIYSAAVLAVVALACSPMRARAEEPKSGAVYYINRTDAEITIDGRYIIDKDGDKVAMTASWTLKPGQKGYLTRRDEKIVCREFAYTLTTADGSSNWNGRAVTLDADGDFQLALTAANLAEHKKLTRGKGADDDKADVTARRSKEAWDAMGKVDAQTAAIVNRSAIEYWEKFNAGYGQINKDDIDPDLDRLIRSWTSLSADFHKVTVQYYRTRATLVKNRDDLGDCPQEVGPAFLWGLAFGALTRQIVDLDSDFKTTTDGLVRRKKDLEKREGDVAETLTKKYPTYRFGR
jgi:hypothetical protein